MYIKKESVGVATKQTQSSSINSVAETETKKQSNNKKSSGADERVRNFACVVYPESAPSDWLTILEEQHIPAFVSPIHDKDLDPQNQPKKPHHHVLIMFDGKKSIKQAKAVFESINGVGCEVVKSIRGYTRYLCHLDNPEKAQYKQSDVISLSGANYVEVTTLVSDKRQAIKEMIAFVKQEDLLYYDQLVEYAMEERDDWFSVLCEQSILIKDFMQSRKWRKRDQYLNGTYDKATGAIIDEETGEVIKQPLVCGKRTN